MQQKELGFILKRFFPIKQKLSVLSCTKGKIEFTTQPIHKCAQFWPGMLVAFHLSSFNRKIWLANETEILLSPLKNTYQNIKWIHKILELCYFFLPLEQPCPEIFDYLYNSLLIVRFEKHFSNQIEVIKKIYLLKFFELTGLYPDTELLECLSLYDQLSLQSVDFENHRKIEFIKMILRKVTPTQLKKMDAWLLSCIKSHPCCNYFKTNKVI